MFRNPRFERRTEAKTVELESEMAPNGGKLQQKIYSEAEDFSSESKSVDPPTTPKQKPPTRCLISSNLAKSTEKALDFVDAPKQKPPTKSLMAENHHNLLRNP